MEGVVSQPPPPIEWSQEVRRLGNTLLQPCLDSDTSVSVAALIETLILVLIAGAPSPDKTKRMLRSMLEGAEVEIDKGWAARPGTPSDGDREPL
jgi:hypothetical protein